MLKKVVKYTDFNGQEREDTIYFNLTKSELTKLELGVKGGLSTKMEEAVKNQDNVALSNIFNMILLNAYGVKSDDGKRFIKSETARIEFEQSAVYDVIFMEIAQNEEAALAFMKAAANLE